VPLRSVNGVRLLVEESGEGDPLVLVHGSWSDRQGWAFVEEDLARSFRVTSYDRRGRRSRSASLPAGLIWCAPSAVTSRRSSRSRRTTLHSRR
jgi:pimeloyl-ACP methyl ester carboxylesterase